MMAFCSKEVSGRNVSMGWLKLPLLIAILSLLPSCSKEKIHTERIGWKVYYGGTPIPITSLLPDLEGETISTEGGLYSLAIPFPDSRYSYTPERIWIEPQDFSFSAQMGVPPSCATSSPVSVPFHTSADLSFLHGLHKGADIETLGYGAVTGTLTVHISYPESLPCDKIRLAAGSQFILPPFIRVNTDGCPEVRRSEGSGETYITTTKEFVIPRTGYDFTFECTTASTSDLTGEHLPPLSGRFSCEGVVILSPEDLTDPNYVEWEPSLNISLSTSVIEFTSVSAVTNTPVEKGVISVNVPFPKLSEPALNRFNLAQAKARIQTNGFYFSGNFCAKTGADKIETDPFYFSIADIPLNYFYSQPLGSVEYTSHWNLTEYSHKSVNGLNDLVKTAPDSIGFYLQATAFPGSFHPGQEYYFDISTTVYIPLMFAGIYWGKTFRTESITIPANDLKNACPGTVIEITGWVMNRQAFDLKAVPVVVDADGVSHRFEEDAITAEGSRFFTSPNGQKEFYIRWTAESTNRPISIYLEITLETGSYDILAPDQDIIYGIKRISKEVLP